MKNKFTLIMTGLLSMVLVQLNAQYRYVTSADTTYLVNEEYVDLKIPATIRGTVNWQKANKTGWETINTTEGETATSRVKADTTERYRVMVAEGTCDNLLSDTITVGYAKDLKDLTDQGFSFNYLLNTTKIPVKDFINDGVSIAYLVDQGLPLDSLLSNNAPIEEILAAGITVEQLLDKNVSITDLFDAKVGVGTLLDNGVDSSNLKTAGLIGTLTDQEGGTVPWVKIGKQIWMAENLAVKHYNNSDLLYTTNPVDRDITIEPAPAYYWAYGGSESNANIYGYLYSWHIINDATSRNVCPTGWHVPSSNEFDTLVTYLGGIDVAGGALKETGTSHWKTPNEGATNASGFNALPGGYRSPYGGSAYLRDIGYFWTSTNVDVTNADAGFATYENSRSGVGDIDKKNGYSIRCIKD